MLPAIVGVFFQMEMDGAEYPPMLEFLLVKDDLKNVFYETIERIELAGSPRNIRVYL